MEMNVNCDFSVYDNIPIECKYVGAGCIKISLGYEGDEEINITLKMRDAENLIRIIQNQLDEVGY